MILSLVFDVPVILAIAGAFFALKRHEARLALTAAAVSIIFGIALIFVFGGKFQSLLLAVAPALIVAAIALELRAVAFLNGFSFSFAYWLGWWMASATRQVAFELSAHGHITNAFDSCAAALAPYAVFIVTAIVCVAGGIGSAVRLRLAPPLFAGVFVLCGFLGAEHGGQTWTDWQPDQPCL